VIKEPTNVRLAGRTALLGTGVKDPRRTPKLAVEIRFPRAVGPDAAPTTKPFVIAIASAFGCILVVDKVNAMSS
jgi:hypothetical protein